MTSSKSLCATCHKSFGIFTCRGCTNEYCIRHATEHRQFLSKQMEEIIVQHDEYLQIILDQNEEINHHPLIKQINQWEEDSIKTIHQIANQTREELFNLITKDIIQLKDDMKIITKELNQARIEDDYVEPDLNLWINKLQKIKKNLSHQQQQTFTIQSNNKQSPLIFNIAIKEGPKDIFEKFLGDIHIEDYNQVIIHGQNTQYASVRCRNEYSVNEHRIQFQIEHLNEGKWVFIGIISKNRDLQLNSLLTPTCYGWSAFNNVSLNGTPHLGYKGYKTDIEMNDILELIIDCNRKMICLINQRTESINKLYVDIIKCPFPWQINLGLYFKNDQIRILSASSSSLEKN